MLFFFNDTATTEIYTLSYTTLFRSLGLLLAGAPASAWAATARAELKDAQGKVVGRATLSDASGGVKVALKATGLKPGAHGFHIHAVGKCEPPRSEEHTSELQSPCNLVCRLLLEKKKKNTSSTRL